MKYTLLTVIFTGLMFISLAQNAYQTSYSTLLTTRYVKDSSANFNNELTEAEFTPQNNYAFGIYGSSKLPVGYQIFFNLRSIGKLKANMGLLFYNQFSTHSNYDISGIILKKNILFNRSAMTDILTLNFRTRKLHFSDQERNTRNIKAAYGLVLNGRTNIGAGIDNEFGPPYDMGLVNKVTNHPLNEISQTAMMLTAGRYFPGTRVNLTSQLSFFDNRTDYRLGISKTFSTPNTAAIYGVEVYYEEYRGYNDVSVGLMIYL